MRIIAGQKKGRIILVPKGNDVRPTTDRAREAMFSRLGSFIKDTVVLDLFAGSGSLGLESLSRGAKKVVFIESSYQASTILKQNISNLDVNCASEIIFTKAHKYLSQTSLKDSPFDLVFLDPPYEGSVLTDTLEQISKLNLLSEKGFIIAECPTWNLPLIPANLEKIHEKNYGKSLILTLKLTRTCCMKL